MLVFVSVRHQDLQCSLTIVCTTVCNAGLVETCATCGRQMKGPTNGGDWSNVCKKRVSDNKIALHFLIYMWWHNKTLWCYTLFIQLKCKVLRILQMSFDWRNLINHLCCMFQPVEDDEKCTCYLSGKYLHNHLRTLRIFIWSLVCLKYVKNITASWIQKFYTIATDVSRHEKHMSNELVSIFVSRRSN